MSSKETTYKKPRIEKFKGKFKEIDGGGTILFTKTIQSIRNPNDLAIYVYLASKPDEWNVNIKELMTHFIKMGRDKVYKCLNDLCLIGLMERKEKRNKSGKFLEYQYFLYLKPVPCFQELNKPLPDLPDPGLPLPENTDTYKTKRSCIKNIESKKGLIKTPTQEDKQQYHYHLSKGESIPKEYLHVKQWLDEIKKQNY